MKKIAGIIVATTLVTACAIDPYTGEKKVSNTGWGAGIGAAGGAVVGGVVGHQVGKSMEKDKKDTSKK